MTLTFITSDTTGARRFNNDANGNREYERSDHWVNTVLIGEGKVTQIGFCKPLKFLNTSNKTATSSEEFNEVDALSNVVINQLHSIGQRLQFGEAYIMAPGYNDLPDSHETLTLE